MERVTNIIEWMQRLPQGADVGIGEDALTLRAVNSGKLLDEWYEIGGIPVRIEHGMDCRCEGCRIDMDTEHTLNNEGTLPGAD